MKIVIFGATGHVGQRIAKEALERGHEVVGVVRDPARSRAPDPRVTLVRGDATDVASVASVVRGADAVVNSISPRPGSLGKAPSLAAAARAVIAGLAEAGVKRLLVVGGAGSLEVAPGVRLLDTPEFPEAYRAEALEGAESFAVYRAEADGLEWTYVSPAIVIQPGERTGRYRTTGDRLLVDETGRSVISYEDYAVAILDEIERREHVRERIGVAYGSADWVGNQRGASCQVREAPRCAMALLWTECTIILRGPSSSIARESSWIKLPDEAVLRVIREWTTAEYLAAGAYLNRKVRAEIAASVAGLHPDWSSEEVDREVARRFITGEVIIEDRYLTLAEALKLDEQFRAAKGDDPAG